MQLNSGLPYWSVRNGLMRTYPRLSVDVSCDVLIVGAGITGALVGFHLARAGMSVVVIDGREVGWGSSSASTALLQYEIDTEMQELRDRYGLADATLAYRSCADAIPALQRIASALPGVDFQRTDSLYYASRWYHRSRLEREAAIRSSQGLPLTLLDRKTLKTRYGIEAPIGLVTSVAAQVDPYRFAHRLLAAIHTGNGQVHARTTLESFRSIRGGMMAQTEAGPRIRCKQLVIAAGYESQKWIDQRVARNRSSYAFVSEPLPGQLGRLRRTMVWESARPYLYVRSTTDQRLLVGGEDDDLDVAIKRDLKVDAKAEKLRKRAQKLLPDAPLINAFAWGGTFAETEDGLPFFGPHPQHGPRVHFAMAYGGNGITYSLIGSEIFQASMKGDRHPCAALFGFSRLDRH